MLDSQTPLSPDPVAFQKSLDSLVQNLGDGALLTDYVRSIRTIALGSRPLVLDGQTVGEFDPLASQPELTATIETAQANAYSMGQLTFFFFATTKKNVADFSGQFQEKTGEIFAILEPLGDQPPNPEQQAAILQALVDLRDGMRLLDDFATLVQDRMEVEVPKISEDFAVLGSQNDVLGSSIRSLEANARAISLNYPPQLAPLVLDLLQQVLSALRQINGYLVDAQQAIPAASQELSLHANAIATLLLKYDSEIRALEDAADADFGSVLLEMRLDVAQRAWAQIADFVATISPPSFES